jgi:hypothetical protein
MKISSIRYLLSMVDWGLDLRTLLLLSAMNVRLTPVVCFVAFSSCILLLPYCYPWNILRGEKHFFSQVSSPLLRSANILGMIFAYPVC